MRCIRDSSRFWTIESYQKGGEPRKLDKDWQEIMLKHYVILIQ